MNIDITKPVKTRDGRVVEIISDKCRSGHPLIGYIETSTELHSWSPDGRFTESRDHLLDLVQPEVRWINFYPNGRTDVCMTRSKADDYRGADCRIACVKVTYTPGQIDEE